MAKQRNMDSNELAEKEGTFAKLLDDLTTLEINTIIKKGMTAAPPPEKVEEAVQGLLFRYRERMDRILNRNIDDLPFKASDHKSEDNSIIKNLPDIINIKDFHEFLIAYKSVVDEKGKDGTRLPDIDYTRILRMISFCNFIKVRSNGKGAEIDIQGSDKKLYPTNIEDITNLKLIISTRDTVKINRFYDLGDETIVMQTRFGIDGDIVTRIEEDFSNRPKEMITRVHDEHTNLSVNYWKSLIDIAKGIIFRGER